LIKSIHHALTFKASCLTSIFREYRMFQSYFLCHCFFFLQVALLNHGSRVTSNYKLSSGKWVNEFIAWRGNIDHRVKKELKSSNNSNYINSFRTFWDVKNMFAWYWKCYVCVKFSNIKWEVNKFICFWGAIVVWWTDLTINRNDNEANIRISKQKYFQDPDYFMINVSLLIPFFLHLLQLFSSQQLPSSCAIIHAHFNFVWKTICIGNEGFYLLRKPDSYFIWKKMPFSWNSSELS
jgi:hypothetical protein